MNEKQAKRLRRADRRRRKRAELEAVVWSVIHPDIYRKLVEAGIIMDVHSE